jgi:hypothetical protein
MDEVFGTVLIAVSLVAVLIAAISYWGSGRIYRGLGRTGAFTMEDESEHRRRQPAAMSPAAQAEAREEIRQMLEAKSARRERRGEPPLDIDAEMEALMRPAVGADPELREEVRQLVVARNARRVRQGKEPLDVEAEVERQLRDLGA